jgi:enoyl-CoA hydratase/carnithine racemase
MSGPVTSSVDSGVATITIDRPEALNALNIETLDALREAIQSAKDTEASVLVFTGAGDDAFIAGADIQYMRELSVEGAYEYASMGHELIDDIKSYPGPAIAAINGYAFGGGAELALGCDLRVASEQAVIGQTEIDLGIVPGWGGTQRLPSLVGDEIARRLVFFGERVDASDAHEIGLVGEVVAHEELDDHVQEMAEELAAKPSFALAAAKESINMYEQTTMAGGLAFERRLWSSLYATADQREGMTAFLEDRDPDFE